MCFVMPIFGLIQNRMFGLTRLNMYIFEPEKILHNTRTNKGLNHPNCSDNDIRIKPYTNHIELKRFIF